MTSAAVPAVSGEDSLVPPKSSIGVAVPAKLTQSVKSLGLVEHSAQPRSPGATISGVIGPLWLKPPELNRFVVESYVVMLAAMAPHLGEELWRALGHSASVHLESWPTFDESMTREDTVTVVVQVNGKVRDRLRVTVGASEAEVHELALKSEAVARHLGGQQPKKLIFVPNRMLSIVV